MNNYVKALYEEALKHRNSTEAVRLSNYMRNQFEYIGLRAPQMQEVFKQHVKTYGLPAKEEQTWRCSRILFREPAIQKNSSSIKPSAGH